MEEAENVWIDSEGDFIYSESKKSAHGSYDTVAEWCKDATDNIVKEMLGEDNNSPLVDNQK